MPGFLFDELNEAPPAPPKDPIPSRESQTPEEAKWEGMEAVLHSADPEWLILASMAIRAVAKRQEFLTSDQVWKELGDRVPREPRALGPVMTTAARNGLIRKTDRVQNSERVENHSRPVSIWKSLLFSGGESS